MCSFNQITRGGTWSNDPGRRGILEPYAGPNGAMIGSVSDSKSQPAAVPQFKGKSPFLNNVVNSIVKRDIESRFAGPNAVPVAGSPQGANISGVKPPSSLGSSFMSQGYLPALSRSAASATGRVVT